MDAIRRDEDELDNLHSVYVDQWDWEKVILSENRNLDYLKLTVMDIVKAPVRYAGYDAGDLSPASVPAEA